MCYENACLPQHRKFSVPGTSIHSFQLSFGLCTASHISIFVTQGNRAPPIDNLAYHFTAPPVETQPQVTRKYPLLETMALAPPTAASFCSRLAKLSPGCEFRQPPPRNQPGYTSPSGKQEMGHSNLHTHQRISAPLRLHLENGGGAFSICVTANYQTIMSDER